MKEFTLRDVCDMEVDLAEVMWQESDASIAAESSRRGGRRRRRRRAN